MAILHQYTCSAKNTKACISNPYAFYPYQVKQGDRPDTVSEGYYGRFFYSWIVYLSNNILDPYFQWQMTQQIFQEFITEKYGYVLAKQTSSYVIELIGTKTLLLFFQMLMTPCLIIKRNTMRRCSWVMDIVSYDRAKFLGFRPPIIIKQ